jgi:hypothetical protein
MSYSKTNTTKKKQKNKGKSNYCLYNNNNNNTNNKLGRKITKKKIYKMKGGSPLTEELTKILLFYEEFNKDEVPHFQSTMEAFKKSKGWSEKLVKGAFMADGTSGVGIEALNSLKGCYRKYEQIFYLLCKSPRTNSR